MKAKYSRLFKILVESYYSGNFDDKLNELIDTDETNKEEIAAVIASLCGVEITYGDNFIQDIKKALTSYEAEHKIVNKVKQCSMDCITVDGRTLCQKSCPFDAIFIDKEKHTSCIDPEKCTDCGFCVEGCPAGSILDRVEFLPLANLLRSGKTVIAAVAPAICGQFGPDVTINQLRTAFKKMGFDDMVEVAFFADMLTLKEAVEFDLHVKSKNDFMITSCCCPMWVGMLKRVYKDLVKHVSPSISPMIAAGRVIKALNPECTVVFIGPCIAKKAEAKEKDLAHDIDFVLTFAELKDIFEALNIIPGELKEDLSKEYASRGGRLYARTGGVSTAVGEAIEKLFPEKFKLLKTVQADGIKNCKELLSMAEDGGIDANFLEGMGCPGGCVGGPKAIIPREEGTERVNEFAEGSEIRISVDSKCMQEILSRLNIYSAEDFKDASKIEIFEREF